MAQKVDNNEKILLYNRKTGIVEEEKVFEKGLMDLIYNTVIGRCVTNLLLKKKFFTKLYGIAQNKPKSKRKIGEFIDKYNIDLDEIELPISSYNTFNEFFIRKLKPHARPVCKDPQALISPADARLLTYNISMDTIIPVKGIKYTLQELVRDKETVKPFIDGVCMVFRLAPVDYHRFCYIDDGHHKDTITIDGFLHSVNPISLSKDFPVFQENYRQYTVLHTKNFDDVIHMDVGAMIVGKIIQANKNGCSFERGQEKGYFEFGGSTVVLLFKPNVVSLDEDIQNNSKKGIETLVKFGEKIGKTKEL